MMRLPSLRFSSRALALRCALALPLAFAAQAAGCKPFAIKTPPGMIELEDQTDYAYRAMTPDGVVLGIRVVKGGKADVAFWTQAVTLHMKELSGYALLGTTDVTSADGSAGKELRFGHDESGKPYAYIVRVFVQGEKLFVVEAGGTKDEVEHARPTLDAALSTLRLK
jgi:hypothetical protein